MIPNRLILCLLIPVAFLLGFVFGKLNNNSADINTSQALLPASSSIVTPNNLSDLCQHFANLSENDTSKTLNIAHNTDTTALMSIYAHTVLARSTASDIESQLKNIVSDSQLVLIQNKKAFAARVIDEYLSPSSTVPPTAQVKVVVSYSNDLSVLPPQNYFNIPKKSSVFIHLQSEPSLLDGNVFVKVLNAQTNKVLLYTAKPISKRQDNWVSFEPVDGWSNANYRVVVYTLTDSLQAVGGTEFTVNPLLDN